MPAVVEHAFRGDVDYYEERALGLLASAKDGTPGALERFRRWSAPATPDGAREVLARQHGLASWAALRGHVERLGERGDPFALAAAKGRVASLRRLLALGADPNGRTSFGGPDHGEGATPLHLAAEAGRADVARVLLEAGADPSIEDARHGHTPAGWAEHGG